MATPATGPLSERIRYFARQIVQRAEYYGDVGLDGLGIALNAVADDAARETDARDVLEGDLEAARDERGFYARSSQHLAAQRDEAERVIAMWRDGGAHPADAADALTTIEKALGDGGEET